MAYDFDRMIDRRSTQSIKWNWYGEDVLPLWVADMDFQAPYEVVDALVERARNGVFGYTCEPDELGQVLMSRLENRYGWKIQPESIVFLGGVVAGFNLACHAVAKPGGGLLLCPPIYPPMLDAATNAGMMMQAVRLLEEPDGSYSLDLDGICQAIQPETRGLLLCNPHNPVGKVLSREDLEKLASICLERNLWIISDEIHCDLVYPGHAHVPIASLNPEVAARTLTLMAPSKTFNIPGLGCSFAIVEDAAMRKQLSSASQGLLPHVNLMAYTAALAAYKFGQPWLVEVLDYLWRNYRILVDTIHREMPEIKVTPLEGTYLAWLDCRPAGLQPDPYHFFLEKARVALNDGASFGDGGEGFVRLNFACPRSILTDALERMINAMHNR